MSGAAARDHVLHAAAQVAASCPELVFHNPDKVTAGWAFRWESDGERLLRERKSSWYARPPLPRITVLSERLAGALREPN